MSSDLPKLDDRWQAKYRAKYSELCSGISAPSAASSPAANVADSAATSSGDTHPPDDGAVPQGAPAATREQQLAQQMQAYATAEVKDALARLRRHGPLSPVRWLLGALVSTTSFQNPLPFTGMSLLFHASRAAEALGFEHLDHVLPYMRVGQDWAGATAQQLLLPRGLSILHLACTPVFGLLKGLDDPLVVTALYGAFGLGVVAARHVLDGLIARRSVQHVLQLVQAAAVEHHMEWVRSQLIEGSQTGAITPAGSPSGQLATTK